MIKDKAVTAEAIISMRLLIIVTLIITGTVTAPVGSKIATRRRTVIMNMFIHVIIIIRVRTIIPVDVTFAENGSEDWRLSLRC